MATSLARETFHRVSTRTASALALGALLTAAAPAAFAQDGPSAGAEPLERRVRELEQKLEAVLRERDTQGADDELAALKAAGEDEVLTSRREDRQDTEQPGFLGQSLQLLNALNPRATVFVDMLAPVKTKGPSSEFDDRVSVREVEVDLRAAIDPYATGVFILAVEEDEPGEYIVDAEEAYLTLDTLPLGFRLKMGRFFPEIGNVNRLHTHDLPWSVRPLANRDFIAGDASEGWKEYGAQVTWLAPKLGPLSLTLSGYVLNGAQAEVLAGSDSRHPAYMGRAEAFIELDTTHFLTLGGNFLFGYNDADGSRETNLWAADAFYKYQPSLWSSFVLFGELYYLRKEVDGGREYAFGAWAGAQVQPNLGRLWAPLQNTYFGVRYDFSTYDQQVEDSDQWAISAYASFYTTEFLRFRVGYEHRERASTFFGRPDEDTVFFQVTFVFGSHPVEPFWFNR